MGIKKSGFTLLELIIVIILIGALSAIALPRILENDIKEVAFYDQVAASVRYAQRLSVNSGCEIQVRLSNSPAGVSLWRRAGANDDCGSGEFTQAVVNPTTGTSYTILAESGITMDAQTIVFNSEGNPNPNGVSIIIAGRPLLIEAGSGYVE